MLQNEGNAPKACKYVQLRYICGVLPKPMPIKKKNTNFATTQKTINSMHKIALDALKTRFQGISEKVLDRIAENIAKTATTAEEVKSTVEEITIQQIIDAEGDRRATDAQRPPWPTTSGNTD